MANGNIGGGGVKTFVGRCWYYIFLPNAKGIPLPADYDMVVIGASFGGLACARQAARRGLRVLVLDRQSAPGARLHTTGILVKEAQDTWAAPAHLVREITGVRVYAPSHRSAKVERQGYFFLATDTAGLMQYLVDETSSDGVEVRFGEEFESARQQGQIIVLDELNLSCRFLVGADGARSRVARSFGLDRNTRYLKGVEYGFEPLAEMEECLHCFVDHECAPGYIGWVLPGISVTQVGLACLPGHQADIDKFINGIDPLFGLSDRRILETRGGIIPIGGLLNNFYGDRVLLIGDAAGMVSPLTAGGIHRAYLYGSMAGNAIAEHLFQEGPHPGALIRSAYPRSAWKHVARRIYNHLPVGSVLEASLRFPGLFKKVAGKVFFDRGP